MVSELVSNGNMRERLEELDWDGAMGMRYLKGVAAGMAYLHSFDVLHGDLKCENIMIDHDVPKIADFGLSRVRSHLTTGSMNTLNNDDGQMKQGGTPVFMAPERWRGGRLRPPVDVYAFAMVCYEVSDEGGYPFMGLPRDLLIAAVKAGDRPDRPLAASDGLWELMQKMWAQEPADRPTFVEVSATMAAW
ncbi:kinase-like domain-containing protein [Hyaloraphidium curvatum]|nr:kinase-like domain-containing protein [Hyaloraphidium curvatum]